MELQKIQNLQSKARRQEWGMGDVYFCTLLPVLQWDQGVNFFWQTRYRIEEETT
jgi:hypothetical protein